eukprot:573183-Pelagomonas_calceolata.AAC.2
MQLFMCPWDNPHQKFGGRCPHVHVAVREKQSTVCWGVGMGSTGFHLKWLGEELGDFRPRQKWGRSCSPIAII